MIFSQSFVNFLHEYYLSSCSVPCLTKPTPSTVHRPYIHSFLLFCDPVLKALAKPAEKFSLPYWVRMKGVSSCGIGTMCCAVEERVLVVVKIIDVYCDLSDHFDIDITYKPTNTSDSSSDQ